MFLIFIILIIGTVYVIENMSTSDYTIFSENSDSASSKIIDKVKSILPDLSSVAKLPSLPKIQSPKLF